MENDDNDSKDYSLPLLMKQSTDDRDDNAKPNLFARANLEFSKGKLIHRDAKINVHAPSDDEDYLMSDATSDPPLKRMDGGLLAGEVSCP